MSIETLIVEEEALQQRLDLFLAQRYTQFSRTYFQNLILEGNVLINGERCKKREIPSAGDEVEICFVLTPELSVAPQNIPLEILFEDEHLLIINKPAGMVVHPAPGHPDGTFANALLYHCKSLSAEKGDLRPGIVHRLDKDTSGILIAAKNTLAHQRLIEMFHARTIKKTYLAICCGNPGSRSIDAPIGRHPTRRQEMAVLPEKGKPALSHCRTLKTHGKYSLIEVDLITGRTHQIRVHMQHIGCPVAGDPLYGSLGKNSTLDAARQMLHAAKVSFQHPISQELISIKAPIPQDMLSLMKSLNIKL